jgi:hypothetical protein
MYEICFETERFITVKYEFGRLRYLTVNMIVFRYKIQLIRFGQQSVSVVDKSPAFQRLSLPPSSGERFIPLTD